MTTMQPVSLSGLSEDHYNRPRLIHEIARDIHNHWPKVYFGAVPYLEAMLDLNFMSDIYGCDSAESILTYFLANANTFQGEHARRLKQELKDLLAGK